MISKRDESHLPMLAIPPDVARGITERPSRPASRQSHLNETNVVKEEELTYCRATCNCKRCDFRVVFPTAALPIHTYFCNCTSCRHNTGQMAFCTVRMVGAPLDAETSAPFALSIMDAYRPPDRVGVERFFCPTCSCNMLVRIDVSEEARGAADRNGEPYDCGFGRNRSDELNEEEEEEGYQWRVASGALRVSDGIIKPMYHLHLASTLDDGLANHLRTYNGVQLTRYSGDVGSEQLPLHWRSPRLKAEQPIALSAFCHCRSIRVNISRPSEHASRVSAPYPDLIFPTDVTHRAKLRNIEDAKWWLRPPLKEGMPMRYLAGHCACSFCRSTAGFDFQPWGFLPRAHIWEEGRNEEEVIDLYTEALRPEGLKQYLSSPGRYREFCKTCGATAFWWQAGRDLVDVSIGLLDASIDGVRADHWFSWHTRRVSNAEIAPSQKMVVGLTKGLKVCEAEGEGVQI